MAMLAAGAVILSAGPLDAQETAPAQEPGSVREDLLEVWRFEEGDPSAGGKLYRRLCAGCHGEDGRGGAHTFMPHVGNLTKRDYIEFLPDGYLYTVIAEGGAAVGKNSYMPAWKGTLSEAEIKDIVAYIRTLPTY